MALGYDDTPILLDSGYHVHDGNRPQPRIVPPGTESTPQAPGQSPSPRWKGNRLVSPAYVTVLQNGVVLHHHKALQGATGHRNILGV